MGGSSKILDLIKKIASVIHTVPQATTKITTSRSARNRKLAKAKSRNKVSNPLNGEGRKRIRRSPIHPIKALSAPGVSIKYIYLHQFINLLLTKRVASSPNATRSSGHSREEVVIAPQRREARRRGGKPPQLWGDVRAGGVVHDMSEATPLLIEGFLFIKLFLLS